MTDDAEQKRLATIHNERTKLTATWMNNVGVGCVIAGFLAPSLQAVISDRPHGPLLVIGFAIWFLIGVALHFMGRAILKGLK